MSHFWLTRISLMILLAFLASAQNSSGQGSPNTSPSTASKKATVTSATMLKVSYGSSPSKDPRKAEVQGSFGVELTEKGLLVAKADLSIARKFFPKFVKKSGEFRICFCETFRGFILIKKMSWAGKYDTLFVCRYEPLTMNNYQRVINKWLDENPEGTSKLKIEFDHATQVKSVAATSPRPPAQKITPEVPGLDPVLPDRIAREQNRPRISFSPQVFSGRAEASKPRTWGAFRGRGMFATESDAEYDIFSHQPERASFSGTSSLDWEDVRQMLQHYQFAGSALSQDTDSSAPGLAVPMDSVSEYGTFSGYVSQDPLSRRKGFATTAWEGYSLTIEPVRFQVSYETSESHDPRVPDTRGSFRMEWKPAKGGFFVVEADLGVAKKVFPEFVDAGTGAIRLDFCSDPVGRLLLSRKGTERTGCGKVTLTRANLHGFIGKWLDQNPDGTGRLKIGVDHKSQTLPVTLGSFRPLSILVAKSQGLEYYSPTELPYYAGHPENDWLRTDSRTAIDYLVYMTSPENKGPDFRHQTLGAFNHADDVSEWGVLSTVDSNVSRVAGYYTRELAPGLKVAAAGGMEIPRHNICLNFPHVCGGRRYRAEVGLSYTRGNHSIHGGLGFSNVYSSDYAAELGYSWDNRGFEQTEMMGFSDGSYKQFSAGFLRNGFGQTGIGFSFTFGGN